MVIKKIERCIEAIEGAEAPLWQWGAGFLGILFVRFFLETLSGPAQSFPSAPDAATLIHYLLFFTGIFISLTLVFRIFIPDLSRISKFLFFGFPIIWLSPAIDLITSQGTGYLMTYVFAGNLQNFAQVILSFGASGGVGSLTPGLRTELVAIVIGSMLYAGLKTRSWIRAIATGVGAQAVLFFWMLLPGIIVALGQGSMPALAVAPSLVSIFGSSHILENFLRPTEGFSYAHGAETVFNLGMASVIYILDFILIAAWTAIKTPGLSKALVRNLRPERMAFYLGLIVMGLLGAIRIQPGISAFVNWADAALFATLVLGYFSAFFFAIGVNDLADEKIDSISNKNRPIPSGASTKTDFANANLFFLCSIAIAGYIAGYWAWFTLAVFTAAYYIYSAPPLRLKRIPILSSFLIAIAALSALSAGFFFADQNKIMTDLPLRAVMLILICITLAVNFKDIKDVEGDGADGVWTLPVLFGARRGAQIAGLLLGAAFLAVPAIMGNAVLFAPSLIAAVLGYLFATAKKYREWRIFVLYFIYAAVAGGALWLYPIAG